MIFQTAEFEKRPLMVETLDMHAKENAKDHRTDLFELVDDDVDPMLILRRGQDFNMDIKFNRKIVPHLDIIKLKFLFGERLLSLIKVLINMP